MTIRVVTYQSPRGNKINICPACESRLNAAGTWPRDASGEEYCQVSHGLHAADSCGAPGHVGRGWDEVQGIVMGSMQGTPAELTDEQIEAVQATAGQAGDAVQVHLCAIALGQDRSSLVELDPEDAARVWSLSRKGDAAAAREAIAASVLA